MKRIENLFVLAGNSPYDNRGCEAIVRGTIQTLRQHFTEPRFLAASLFQNDEEFRSQALNESDPGISHQKMFCSKKRFTAGWLFNGALRRTVPRIWARTICRRMLPCLREAKAVLVLGGDTYSLDYGRPDLLTGLDDLVLKEKKPLVIWGASIGPFSGMPKYEKYMIGHLKRVTGIFVRENETQEYLSGKGIRDNVRRVADPAFLLEPAEPAMEQKIAGESVGINLSPLMAQYATGGDYKKWVVLASQIVRDVSAATRRKIYLIPHVTTPHTNDHAFLTQVVALLGAAEVALVPDRYNAAETKWIISQMAVFAGARTHATIAAISSGVPTLSFAYSVKAVGINKDIFGHEQYCLGPQALTPRRIAEKMVEMIADSAPIRSQLQQNLPRMKALALKAGDYLRELC